MVRQRPAGSQGERVTAGQRPVGGIGVQVAERSGVRRGRIHQYFGDRRSLLRAAVAARAGEWAAGAKRHWEKPFLGRRKAIATAPADPGVDAGRGAARPRRRPGPPSAAGDREVHGRMLEAKAKS